MRIQQHCRLWIFVNVMCTFHLSSEAAASTGSSPGRDIDAELQIHHTERGTKYGFHTQTLSLPAPTAILLCSGTISDSLEDRFAGQCCQALLNDGYACVTIDIPCHGSDRRPNEPAELAGWCHRAQCRQDFVADFNSRLADVVDHVVDLKLADRQRLVICGTSRGGYLALQYAAHDRRIRCVAAFAPVTKLSELREFRGQESNPLVESLSIQMRSDSLAGRPIWMVIGDQDERVGTDEAIDFARSLTAAARRVNAPSRVELHVLSEPRGHTLPDHVSNDAANWIRKTID